MESDPCPEEGEKILAEAENILAPGLLGVWSLWIEQNKRVFVDIKDGADFIWDKHLDG